MSIRRLLLAFLVASGSLAPVAPSHAEPQGCSVVAPNPSGGGNCRYVATGPGVYTARVPIGGWRIEASPDGGETWRFVAAGGSIVDDRTPGWPESMPYLYPPESGDLDTRPGELVNVAMNIDHICPDMTGCIKLRIGTLEARDRT